MTSLERQVLDALPMTIYTVDLDGRVTFMNRSWARFAQSTGAPHPGDEHAVIGASIWEAIADVATRDQVEQAMATLREGRAPSVTWEFSSDSPGDERIFLMHVSALGGGRAVTGFAFSAVDITPSHRWREALLDTGMALARTISVDRVVHEVAQQLRRAMACDAVAIALADEETATLRLVHHSGFADDAAAVAARLTPVWTDALDVGQVLTHGSSDTIEITAPMSSDDGVLGAITLTS